MSQESIYRADLARLPIGAELGIELDADINASLRRSDLKLTAWLTRIKNGALSGYVSFRATGFGTGASIVACAQFLDIMCAISVHGGISYYGNDGATVRVGFDANHRGDWADPALRDCAALERLARAAESVAPGGTSFEPDVTAADGSGIYRDIAYMSAECRKLATCIVDIALRASRCNFCTASSAMFRCSRCRVAVYCGETCQDGSWKAHKISCKIYAAAREASIQQYTMTPERASALRAVAPRLLK